MRKKGLSRKDIETFLKYPDISCVVSGIILLLAGLFIQEMDSNLETGFVAFGVLIILVGGIIFLVRKCTNKDEITKEDKAMGDYGNAKEMPAIHSLVSVSFNPQTRMCKVEIQEVKKYRTVERYVTRNYIRYPVLSDWKTKSKTFSRSIKLTNSGLEDLNRHPDCYIRMFATDILRKIEDVVPLPSWYRKKQIENEYNPTIKANDQKKSNVIASFRRFESDMLKEIVRLDKMIQAATTNLGKQEAKKQNAEKRLLKAKARKKSIVLSIITFGIYAALTSKHYITKLVNNLVKAENCCNSIRSQIDIHRDNIVATQSLISNKKLEVDRQCEEINAENDKLKDEMEEKLALVLPLADLVEASSDFIPLKHFVGVEYKKIVGIYIIQNNENKKCYVGQSKDVMRRIKQHFKGTKPNNIIFAEDYYTTAFIDKSDLFSIRIIECERAELDEVEKHYINEYDAYTRGYNSTSGNSE